MTAGVQSFDPGAAYLPAAPSNPSSQNKAGGKGVGAHPDAEASDFQSEMDSQDAAKMDQGSARNSGKKLNARPVGAGVQAKDKGKDDAAPAPAAATPVEAVEPQRPVLPITFAPIQPDDGSDDAVEANASQGEPTAEIVSKNVILTKEILQPGPQATVENVVIPAATEQKNAPGGDLAKPPQTPLGQAPVATLESSAIDTDKKVSDDVPERDAAPESKYPQAEPKDSRPPTAPVTVIPDVPNPIVSKIVSKPPVSNPMSTDQIASGQPQKSEIQPVSQPELKVPELTPLEPAAAGAAQKVEDAPRPPGPSALAFAARLTAVEPRETEPTIPKNPIRPAPASDAAVVTRIPVRYAPTAQIIPQITPRAGQKSAGDFESQVEPAKYAGPEFDRSARPDFVVPGSPATNDAARSSQSQPVREPLPAPETEHVIEPPAAPPSSSRDIRVQVPDNNGGSTQVRFLESGGEVRVSVRTADTGLAQSLRSHLNDLSLRLAEGGVPSEIWKPAAGSAGSQNDQHQPDREGRGSEGRQSGSNSGGHSGAQGDPQDQQDRPAWLEEMEASLMARK